MRDLQMTMQMTHAMGESLKQTHGLSRINRRPPTFANILQIVGETNPFNPRQRDINLIALFLPFHHMWKAVAFESAQHSKQLSSRLAGRQ